MRQTQKCLLIWLLQSRSWNKPLNAGEYLEALKMVADRKMVDLNRRRLATVKLPDELGLSGVEMTLC